MSSNLLSECDIGIMSIQSFTVFSYLTSPRPRCLERNTMNDSTLQIFLLTFR